MPLWLSIKDSRMPYAKDEEKSLWQLMADQS